jgi:methionine-rich copper-binding protein CopC
MSTLHRRVKLLIATLLSLGLMLVMVGMASAHTSYPAHAKVNKAIPAIGSTVSQAPTTVTVFTLENIAPGSSKSNLFVYSPAGDLISQGNATVSLTNPREMSITIKPDTANLNGVYVVRWITVSAEDGDPDQGAFVFTVNAAAIASPTPAPTRSTSQGTTPTTSTTNSSGGTPVWVPILVGVLALLVGLGGGLGLGRRSSPASSVASMRKTITQQEEEEASKRP